MRWVNRERLFKAATCPLLHTDNELQIDSAKCPKWIAVRELLVSRLSSSRGFLVALLGDRGRGKTQLAVSIIRHACEKGMSCRYVTTADVFLDIRSTYSRNSDVTERSVIERYANVGLLVLDDFHQRAETAAEQNSLAILLDKRYAARRPTIVIANQSKAEFARCAGDSIVSRMHEAGQPILCDWPTFRVPGSWMKSQIPSDEVVAGANREAATFWREDR
jgi:DNA replication protein DnaC